MNWLKQKWLWIAVAVKTALLTRALNNGRANMDMIMSVVRALLAALGGYVVSKGWFDEATANALMGALITLAVGIWSIWSKLSAKPQLGNGLVSGVLRTLLNAFAGWLVGLGIFDAATANEFIAAIVLIATTVWSWRAKKKTAQSIPDHIKANHC